MPIDNEKKKEEHFLSLSARKELKITGICRVISFDDSYVLLNSSMGDIDVSGRDLKIDALDLDSGLALISGEISGINYIDDYPKKKRFRNR